MHVASLGLEKRSVSFPRARRKVKRKSEAWKVLGRETCAERRGDCCLGRGWFKEREQAIEDGRSID